MKKIALLIADDHPIVRRAVKRIFRKNSEITFCGEANNGFEVMDLIEKAVPDIAIIDLEMPGMNCYDTILALHTKYPGIKTIAYSGFLDLKNQQRAIEMGAVATISKTEPMDVFLGAFQAIIEGKSFHSDVMINPEPDSGKNDTYTLLTLREKQILNLIGKGKTSKQIGSFIGISKWTVDKHRSNIKEKLGITNLAELIRYAIGKFEGSS